MKQYLSPYTIAVVLLSIVLPITFWPEQPVAAQTQPEPGTSVDRSVTVLGRGQASGRPDTALVRLGVVTEADEPAAALEQNSTQTSAVLQQLDALGIPRADIQTSMVRLFPLRERAEQPDEAPAITGYRATHLLTVKVDQVEKAGALLAEVMAAGANQVQGVEFQLTDRNALLAEARAAAVADARQSAAQLARAAGATVGEVRTIVERSASLPHRPYAPAAAEDAASVPVPIEPGEQTVQVEVQVTFALEAS